MESPYTIIVHGGAWAIPDTLAEASKKGVQRAVKSGYKVLADNGSAVDAVVAAVCVLEDDPVFDAGTGSVLTAKGEVEMDSVIMDGKDLNTGAVACVKNIEHPVKLARLVMDKTDHTLLVGDGANSFAKEMGVPTVPTDKLVTDIAKEEFERYMKFRTAVNVSFKLRDAPSGHDTVGAVALDRNGNVAFATSTGGITAKYPGRVGDSPIVGSGGYCDNEVGGVSSTGHGESISKTCLAHTIISSMKQGSSPNKAAGDALSYMAKRVHGSGGVIVLSKNGDIGKSFTTERMSWASIQNNTLNYGLNPGDNFIEELSL